MSTIATTTNTAPFQYPGMTLLARRPNENRYICLVKATTADNYVMYQSTDAGGTWAPLVTIVRANLVDVGQIYLDIYGYLYWAYRTNETSQDRVYIRQINTLTATVDPEVLLVATANSGTPGSYYSGLDVKAYYSASQARRYGVVAVGTNVVGPYQGVTLFGFTAAAGVTPVTANNLIISGNNRWVHSGSGRVGPSIDFEHNGDGYSGTPNLWVTYGRTNLKLVKLPWSGAGWTGSPGETTIYASVGSPDQMCARWDGNRLYMANIDPVTTTQVMLIERNRSNSTTIIHRSGAHTTGVIRALTMAVDPNTGNVRVWAVGTSTGILYQNDWARLTDTWSGWGSTGLTAILGAGVDNFGAKRSSYGDAKWGLYTAASGAPNTLTYTPIALTYAPSTPTWTSPSSGSAADVADPLILAWSFSDLDPGDTQSAYAISKQIGVGALSYWRASDSTWQVAEVQNTSSASTITVPAGWAAATDAMHTFKVKVWDSSSTASGYSAGMMVLPSTPINPVVTSPTANQVLGSSTLPIAWTASEQSQFRIQLDRDGVLDTFTRVTANGWGISDSLKTWSTVNGVAGDYSTSGTVGVHSNGTLNVLRTTTVDVGNTNQDVIVDCIINKATPLSAPVTQRVCARYTDGNNHYFAQVVLTTGGAVTLQLLKKVGGVLSGDLAPLITLQPSAHVSGDSWRVRIQVDGSTLRSKAWKATASEPPTWYQTAIDTDLTTGTLVALISRVDTGNTDALPITTNYDNFVCIPQGWPDYDFLWIGDAGARTYTPAVTFVTGQSWLLILRTRNAEGLESVAQRVLFTVNFTGPASPTLVATPIPASGIIRTVITNPTPSGAQPAVTDQDLFRRPITTDQTVLNANPYFETNVTGWSAVGCTFVRSTAQFHQGVAAGFITPNAGLSDVYPQSSTAYVIPAGTVSMRSQAWLRPTTANKPCAVYLHWYTAVGVYISSSVITTPAVAGTWLFLGLDMAPVDTAGQVVCAAGLTSTPAGTDTCYVDEVTLSISDLNDGVRVAAGLASAATYDDWQAVDDITYEYRAVTRGTSGVTTYGVWTP